MRRLLMPKYEVKVTVDFYGVVEADSEADAEAMGWYWEDEPFQYDGVFDIVVSELEEEEEDEDE
jgi:hypothetical protein